MSTGISWTDETWTVVTGCSKVSAGCAHCYAETLAKRLTAMGKDGYTDLPWTARNASENVVLRPERLEMPLRWRKPRRVFVTSMGDLFHELVPDEFIAQVFAVMYLTPRHTFQVLTKRPERMPALLDSPQFRYDVEYAAGRRMMRENRRGYLAPRSDGDSSNVKAGVWPIPNVWLGTSVEDQRAADERIPHLLRTPAAVRFLSCEPLIGPVDLTAIPHTDAYTGEPMTFNALSSDLAGGLWFEEDGDENGYHDRARAVSWVIAGGESGPNHRPMQDDWARSLRDQCVEAGVPYFFKQHSGHRNEMDPLLDGREWREMPEVAS